MISQANEYLTNNPQMKQKLIVGGLVVVFIFIAILTTGGDNSDKKKQQIVAEMEEDLFNLNGTKYDFSKDMITQKIEEVDNKIKQSEDDTTEKLDKLTEQVATLSELVAEASNKELADSEIVEDQINDQMALFRKKLNNELKRARKELEKERKLHLQTQEVLTKKLANATKNEGPITQQTTIIGMNEPDENIITDSTGEVYNPNWNTNEPVNQPIIQNQSESSGIPFNEGITSLQDQPEVNSGFEINFYGDENKEEPQIVNGQEQGQLKVNGISQAKDELVDQILGKEEEPEDKGVFLPAGSLLSGSLISGVDMPTGNISKNNPIPVMIRINDTALLPNSRKLNLRGCIAIASGFGEMSTERVMLRTNTLSCIRKDGGVVEVGLKASVLSTEDAKVGIRGVLVTKAGALIGRSMIAGGLSGLSKGLTPNPVQSYSDSPGEERMFQYTRPQDLVASAVGQGGSDAMSKIAEYFLEMADETRPVISVSAGSTVDIVVTTGTNIKVK